MEDEGCLAQGEGEGGRYALGCRLSESPRSKIALMHLYIWYGFNMYVTLPLITFHPARNEYYSLQIWFSPSILFPLIPN